MQTPESVITSHLLYFLAWRYTLSPPGRGSSTKTDHETIFLQIKQDAPDHIPRRKRGRESFLDTAVASAAYDAANEQTAFAGAALTYDNNGNRTSDGTNTHVWDSRNRLVSMSGGATATFNYDALGRRTNKVVNSVASQFLYDGNDIAAEIGGGVVGANYLRSLNIDEPFIRESSQRVPEVFSSLESH